MKNLQKSELNNVKGGSFWGDLGYIIGTWYYECENEGQTSYDYGAFSELNGPKL